MTRTLTLRSILRFGVPNLMSLGVNALVEADRRYRERCQLGRMSDAELRDIGMTREDLIRL